MGLPSGEHLVFGLNTRESVVVENNGDAGVLQPSQALSLKAV
jgi:hypothetical protein